MGDVVFNFNFNNNNQRNRSNNCNSNCNSSRNNTWRIENAFIEEVAWENQNGLLTITFGVPGRANAVITRKMLLVIDNNTVIKHHRGQRMSFRQLRVGMNIDVECIRSRSRNMPARANATSIVALSRNANSVTREGCIIEIDLANNFILMDHRNNSSDILRLTISNETILLNQQGRKICLEDLCVGQNIRVEHATFQTASIPPQTAAFRIRVI